MKSSWKIALIIAFIAVLCGSALLWRVHKHKADEEKFVEAANACRLRAAQGDPKAESELAYMYSHGEGVPQDYSETLRWRRKATDQGYADGENGLGYMYFYGQGVPQDYQEAFRWYSKAADHGDAKAQNSIALMYEQGQGVPQDYAEALRWYHKAVDQNYARAQYNLGNMYYYGRGIPRDLAEAYRWYRKAANQKDEYAQRVLGLRGRGINTFIAAMLLVTTLGSLLLLIPGNRPQRSTTRVGLVGLCCVGMALYAHSRFSFFPSELAVNGFNCARYILVGIFLFLLISVLTSLVAPKRAKALLGILGTIFLIFNVFSIGFAIAHHGVWSFPPADRLFFSTNGLLVGMSLAISLWRTKAGQVAVVGEQ